MVIVRMRIEGVDLPGLSCPAGAASPTYSGVHVGVQRRGRPDDLLDLAPGDAAAATWTLECTTRPTADGLDVTGPCIQGRPGDRFVYLSWGTVAEVGTFTMFRRAKLMLDAVDPAVLEAAADDGVLVARLGLTDNCGEPLCAAVRPPRITWTAEPAP